MTVSFFLAVLSVFAVKSNIREYLTEYINYSVIVLLFCFMVSVAGLSKNGFLKKLANSILKKTGNSRRAATLIIITTFFSSMFITNDVALITFVPICLILFREAYNQSQLIKVITFQTLAANLGSVLTPFGNPQNLFLYTHYGLDFVSFLKITAIPTVIGLILLLLSMFFIIPKDIAPRTDRPVPYSKKKTLFYGIMFLISLMPIFHIWHYTVSLLIIVTAVLIFDRKVLGKIDYSLLFTFICFFIFIGNMQRFPGLYETINNLLKNSESTYFWGVCLSQIISNVPASILLSGFTDDFRALVLGVNVGGLGTLIASLANVISYNFFKNFRKSQKSAYLKYFFWVNVIYLAIMFTVVYLLL